MFRRIIALIVVCVFTLALVAAPVPFREPKPVTLEKKLIPGRYLMYWNYSSYDMYLYDDGRYSAEHNSSAKLWTGTWHVSGNKLFIAESTIAEQGFYYYEVTMNPETLCGKVTGYSSRDKKVTMWRLSSKITRTRSGCVLRKMSAPK